MENEEFAPEIIFGHRRYLCPLDLALEVMGEIGRASCRERV